MKVIDGGGVWTFVYEGKTGGRVGTSQEIRRRVGTWQGIEEVEVERTILRKGEVDRLQEVRFGGIPELNFGKEIPNLLQESVDLLIFCWDFLFHGTSLEHQSP